MKWIKITKKTKEPNGQVLAIGFQDECHIGWLRKNNFNDWEVESDSEVLDEIKAYIPLSEVVKSYLKTLL